MPSVNGRCIAHLDIKGQEPLNAEPDVLSLVQFTHTPDELVYCRNHSSIEALDAETYKLKIDGVVEMPLEFTLSDFMHAFSLRVEIVTALQCAGNRRKRMADVKQKDVEGIKWGEATIANVRFSGVPLRNVLLAAGLTCKDDRDAIRNLHVCFASHVSGCQDDGWYGASIPLEKALDESGDVIVALEMNGHPLAPAHGFPFRMVVPGYTGARWVKWLDRITVSPTESSNFYQQSDYKILPPHVETRDQAKSESWWSKMPPITANPLNSVIATARIVPPELTHGRSHSNSTASPASTSITVLAKGYAIPSDSGQITSVCISCNKGRTWKPARITYQEGKWSWTLWEATVTVDVADFYAHDGEEDGAGVNGGKPEKSRKVVLWSRAEDESGKKQELECDWNLRGVGYAGVGEYEIIL